MEKESLGIENESSSAYPDPLHPNPTSIPSCIDKNTHEEFNELVAGKEKVENTLHLTNENWLVQSIILRILKSTRTIFFKMYFHNLFFVLGKIK